MTDSWHTSEAQVVYCHMNRASSIFTSSRYNDRLQCANNSQAIYVPNPASLRVSGCVSPVFLKTLDPTQQEFKLSVGRTGNILGDFCAKMSASL